MAKSIGLSWMGDDETGYFTSRDRGALEKAMLGFIGGLCRVVLERSPEDAGPLALSMPLGVRLKEDAFAVTPLGPRTREWIERARNDPAAGRDFFAWWDQKLSAKDLRNEALALMWLDCRWAEPRTEAEARTVNRVLDLLARAHEMDAGLEMPWREWAELLAIAGETGPLRSTVDTRAAGCPNARLVGYRRAERMEHMLPVGWTIEVPGSFSVEFEDEQATWIAWDHSRTVRVSSMCGMIPEGADLPPPSLEGLPPDAEPVARSVKGGRAAGFFSQQVEDGESFVALSGDVLVRRGDRLNIGLITITFSDPGHRAWALEVWESFQLMAEGDQGDEL